MTLTHNNLTGVILTICSCVILYKCKSTNIKKKKKFTKNDRENFPPDFNFVFLIYRKL